MLEALLTTTLKKAVIPWGIMPAGTPYLGGFYVGEMLKSGIKYSLIVASLSGGESASLAYDTTPNGAGPIDTWDGSANTAALVKLGLARCLAAAFCHNLTLGGFTDWVLPSLTQLELCYRALKPTSTATRAGSVPQTIQLPGGVNPYSNPVGAVYLASSPVQTIAVDFMAGGDEAFAATTYWTSTGEAGVGSYAMCQSFSNGYQVDGKKSSAIRVRAVRMVAHT